MASTSPSASTIVVTGASSGKYWIDKREAKSAPATHDRELARKLWYWSTQQLAEYG